MFWSDRKIEQVSWGLLTIIHPHLKLMEIDPYARVPMAVSPFPQLTCETVMRHPYDAPYNCQAGLSPCGKAFFFATRPE